MFKVCLLLALTAVAGAAAFQDAAPEGAAEPYSYAYETDSSAAAQSGDASGRVTGFYMLSDADGRQRRVDYVADEGGFRAKVNTNELGTKPESPANVELLASPPTPAQYYQTAAAAAPVQTAQYVRQQTVQTAPAVGRTFQNFAYRPTSGYYAAGFAPGVYGANYNSVYGGYGGYGAYGAGYGTGYGAGYTYAPASGYSYGYAPASYSYVTGGAAPAGQYYSYRSSSAQTQPASYRYRTVSSPAVYSTGYQTVGVPGAYASVPATGAAQSASYQGSSNYLVLQKREAEKEKAEEKKEESS